MIPGLRDADAEMLKRKRGLPEAVIRARGFVSNTQANHAVLIELAQRYSFDELEAAGLWKRRKDGSEVPQPQLHGLGRTGEKDADGEDVWDWIEPVLIPYWSETGELLALRPHKGNPDNVQSLLYVPRVGPGYEGETLTPALSRRTGEGETESVRSRIEQFETVVITEGEFKADALWAVLDPRWEGVWGGSVGPSPRPSPAARGRGSSIGFCAIPGIWMARNESIKQQLLAWLRKVGAKRVVVAFDSEEKSDPKLKSYKSDPNKRHDAEICARFLARWISYQWAGSNDPHPGPLPLPSGRGSSGRQKFKGLVAHLPKEWRDENGKADWDGVLARWVSLDPHPGPLPSPDGRGSSPSPPRRRPSSLNQMRAEFLKVINGARAPGEIKSGEFFESREEKLIRAGENRLWHKPRLLYGGGREEDIAEALFRAAENHYENAKEGDGMWLYSGRARFLAEQFKATRGHLYTRKKQEKLPAKVAEEMRAMHENLNHSANNGIAKLAVWERQRNEDRRTFFEEFFAGYPENVANFRLEPRYLMVCADGREKVRLADVVNKDNERFEMVEIKPEELSQPHLLQAWAKRVGRCTWEGGTKEMQAFSYDVDEGLRDCTVYQLAHWGWHKDARIWMLGDCALEESRKADVPSRFVLPDENGIYWINDIGYKMADRDVENQDWKIEPPKWQPEMGLRFKGMKEGAENPNDAGPSPQPSPVPTGEGETESVSSDIKYELVEGEDDPAALRRLFVDLCEKLKEAIAGEHESYEAFMAMGAIFSYALAPEYFERYRSFSGLWISGARGAGKNTLMRWLMRLLGYESETGLVFSGTKVGVAIALRQFCNLFVWFDEVNDLASASDSQAIKDRIEFLKSAWDRMPPPKFESTGTPRHILTAPFVTGEHTSTDSALRSRYPAFTVSKERRVTLSGDTVDHEQWFEDHKKFFFVLAGRCGNGARGFKRGRWNISRTGWKRRNCARWKTGRGRITECCTARSWQRGSCLGEKQKAESKKEKPEKLKSMTTNRRQFLGQLLLAPLVAKEAAARPADSCQWKIVWDDGGSLEWEMRINDQTASLRVSCKNLARARAKFRQVWWSEVSGYVPYRAGRPSCLDHFEDARNGTFTIFREAARETEDTKTL